MKFRDTVGRYRSSPKWRSWRPSPSVLVTVVSLMVLTGSIAWASDATVRVTATDDATGQQSGIGVLYKDTGNGDYAPAMVRADPNVGADAHVRLTGTDAQGQQTGVNVAYHDTGNGDYAPIFQEVNAQGTPVTGGGGAAPTATPSCADLGGNCTFTSVAVSGSTGNTSLSVAGVQPATGDAREVVNVNGAAGSDFDNEGSAGTGAVIRAVAGAGGSVAGTQGGSGGPVIVTGGAGGRGGGSGFAAGPGGSETFTGGAGGAGDTAASGGAGGANTLAGGVGGDGAGTSAAGAGGKAAVKGGVGGRGDTGNSGIGGEADLTGGNGGTPNGDGGDAVITAGTAAGTGTAGHIQLHGAVNAAGTPIISSAGALVVNGCVMSAATPQAGDVIAATNATTCSFATPAASAATLTPVPTATPQPPVAQQNYCGSSVTSVITTTHYVSVNCGANSTTESAVQIAAPSSTTAQNLYITTQATEGASGNLTVTLRKNGVDTALTVTVPANSAAGNYSDTTHTVSLAAGDLIDFSTIDSGNATSAPWVAAMTFANGVATGTCVLTSATPVPGTFLFAQASNNCVWSTPTPRATATLVATATPQPTETPQIHAAVTQNTPAAGTTLFFPGPQGTPGIYVTPTGGGSASGYSFLTQNYANSQSCSPCGAGVQVSAGATTYLNIGLWFPSITESYREDVVPYNATAGFLTMHGDNSTSQPATGNLTCTLRRLAGPAFTAADTTVTTNIAAGSGTSSVTDSTHTASFAAGDMFSFKCVNGASTGSIYLKSLAIGFKPS